MLSYLADIIKPQFRNLQLRVSLAFSQQFHDKLLRIWLNQE